MKSKLPILSLTLLSLFPIQAMSEELVCKASHRFGWGTVCAMVQIQGTSWELTHIRVIHRKEGTAKEKYEEKAKYEKAE